MDKMRVLDILRSQKQELATRFAVSRLALFGSYSRGEQRSKSDIDIAFELKDGATIGFLKMIEMEEFLRSKLQQNVDLVRLKYMDPVIKLEAEQDMIYV